MRCLQNVLLALLFIFHTLTLSGMFYNNSIGMNSNHTWSEEFEEIYHGNEKAKLLSLIKSFSESSDFEKSAIFFQILSRNIRSIVHSANREDTVFDDNIRDVYDALMSILQEKAIQKEFSTLSTQILFQIIDAGIDFLEKIDEFHRDERIIYLKTFLAKRLIPSDQTSVETPEAVQNDSGNTKQPVKKFRLRNFLKTTRSVVSKAMIGVGMLATIHYGASFLGSTLVPSVSEEAPSYATTEIAEPQAKPVNIHEIEFSDYSHTYKDLGKVFPKKDISLNASYSNLIVKSVNVREGDYVAAGTVLVDFDTSVWEQELVSARLTKQLRKEELEELVNGASATELSIAYNEILNLKDQISGLNADLVFAKQDLARFEYLYKEGAVALVNLNQKETTVNKLLSEKAALGKLLEIRRLEYKRKVDGARDEKIAQYKTNLQLAESRVEELKRKIANASIKAPVSGVILSRDIDPGELSNPQTAAILMAEDGEMEVQVKVPEKVLNEISVGQKVFIKGLDGGVFETQVTKISEMIGQEVPLGKVHVQVPKEQGLRSGNTVSMEIQLRQKTTIKIPSSSFVSLDGQDAEVFVVNADQKLEARKVVLGEILQDGSIEVVSGLEPDEKIVGRGATFLREGQLVTF